MTRLIGTTVATKSTPNQGWQHGLIARLGTGPDLVTRNRHLTVRRYLEWVAKDAAVGEVTAAPDVEVGLHKYLVLHTGPSGRELVMPQLMYGMSIRRKCCPAKLVVQTIEFNGAAQLSS